MKKRALSGVVSVVLLILLVLIAIMIIWMIISYQVNRSSARAETEARLILMRYSISPKIINEDPSTNRLSFSIMQEPGSEHSSCVAVEIRYTDKTSDSALFEDINLKEFETKLLDNIVYDTSKQIEKIILYACDYTTYNELIVSKIASDVWEGEVNAASTGCTEDSNCDDGIGCTIGLCDTITGSCSHIPNDALCNNGIYCDGTETCSATSDCQQGTPIVCNDGDACTDDICDENIDSCVYSNICPQYALTINIIGSGSVASSPPGIACPRDCSETFTEGTEVTLTTNPTSPQEFNFWSGDFYGSENPGIIIMNSDKITAANFAQVEQISTCQTLSTPNRIYRLTNSITSGSYSTCFTITNNNITLDGNNLQVGSSTSDIFTTAGVFVEHPSFSALEYINIKNMNLVRVKGDGIFTRNLRKSSIKDNSITTLTQGITNGIVLNGGRNSVIKNNNVAGTASNYFNKCISTNGASPNYNKIEDNNLVYCKDGIFLSSSVSGVGNNITNNYVKTPYLSSGYPSAIYLNSNTFINNNFKDNHLCDSDHGSFGDSQIPFFCNSPTINYDLGNTYRGNPDGCSWVQPSISPCP